MWSYEFAFGGGRPPWTSGMAQAVAAHALARAASQLGATALLEPARRAFAAVPASLLGSVSARPWVRLYSFNDFVVLNAQLQAAISLGEYGRLSGDARATALSGGLRRAAAALLPRFDTGYWSRYTLVGESSLGYHLYVVKLLEALADRTGLPFWRRAASRFARYTDEAPQVEKRGPVSTLYPTPADGWRDTALLRFWLSKRSDVTVRVGGERRVLALGQGLHAVPWSPPARKRGDFRARIKAVDLAGNRTVLRLPDVRVRVDRTPPRLTARLRGRVLIWRAVDRATPSLHLELGLRRDGKIRVHRFGTRGLRGRVLVKLPSREWRATLRARDVSGNRVRVALGAIGGRRAG